MPTFANGESAASVRTKINDAIDKVDGAAAISSINVDGGTIDGVTIGGASAGAGTFTTLTATGNLTVDTNTLFVDAASNRVGVGNAAPATALDVTGTITSDGLTVDGTISTGGNSRSELIDKDLTFYENNYYIGSINSTSADNINGITIESEFNGDILFKGSVGGTGGSKDAAVKRLLIDGATGDISFYEDTGTTPKFFWDASAEALGIGTTSPSRLLEVKQDVNTLAGAVFRNDSTSSGALAVAEVRSDSATGFFAASGSATSTDAWGGRASTIILNTPSTNSAGGIAVMARNSAGYITMHTGGDGERLRIDSSGNVGIGETSPSSYGKLAILDGATRFWINESTTNEMMLSVGASERMLFGINGTEAMRIDSSGRVGIGTSSPAEPLHVAGSGNNFVLSETTGAVNSAGFRVKAGATATHTIFTTVTSGQLSFFDNVANAERMRIDSSGRVGIGTTSPARLLTINATTALLSLVSSSSSTAQLLFGDTASDTQGKLSYNNVDDSLAFHVNASERMRIDSSGNVGIGTTPSAWTSNFDIQALQITNGGVYGATSDFNVVQNVYFDGSNFKYKTTSGAARYQQLQSSHVWYNAPSGTAGATATFTERMRIDSSGNVLVGTTSAFDVSTQTVSGISAYANGRTNISRDSGVVFALQRQTLDGDIQEFWKDTTKVGSIGVLSSRLYAGTGDTGLFFNDQTDQIQPWNTSTNAARDAAIDLGTTDRRFKDLYLSGGAYIGGTTSANLLDDYEEGEFTTALTPQTSGSITLYSSFNLFAYTKVGRAVTVTGGIILDSVASPVGGYVEVSLPFAIASLNETSERFGGAVTFNDASPAGTSIIPLFGVSGSVARVYIDASTLAASDQFNFSFTYFTT